MWRAACCRRMLAILHVEPRVPRTESAEPVAPVKPPDVAPKAPAPIRVRSSPSPSKVNARRRLRLRLAYNRLRISQGEAATKLGVTETKLSEVIVTHDTAEDLELFNKLCELVGLSPKYVMTGRNPPEWASAEDLAAVSDGTLKYWLYVERGKKSRLSTETPPADEAGPPPKAAGEDDTSEDGQPQGLVS